MKYQNKKSKTCFGNYFLNVIVSIAIAYKDFKFCLHSLQINQEGTLSQIFFYSGLSFYFMSKNGKHFVKL